jgi:hypothetical protein
MSPRTPDPDPDTAARRGAIAAGLTAAVHDTRGVLYVTAGLDQPASKGVEVIVDADGYCQASYWHPPNATAAQVVAAIGRVLAAMTTPHLTVPG